MGILPGFEEVRPQPPAAVSSHSRDFDDLPRIAYLSLCGSPGRTVSSGIASLAQKAPAAGKAPAKEESPRTQFLSLLGEEWQYESRSDPEMATTLGGTRYNALAYKLGQLEILSLRQEARQKLGDKFNLRAFHDEVIGGGPLPLDVLHSQVDGWIAIQEKR